MNQMLCGYRDDSRLWDEAEEAEEEDDPRTLVERRISWICNEWESALEQNTHEDWDGIRLMLYGAIQGITNYPGLDKLEDARAMRELSAIAQERAIDCIGAGRFEGAA